MGKIRRYALEPDGQGGDAWKFTPIFDFDGENGFRKSAILPEIKQERQRQDIQSLVAAREKPVYDRNRRNGERAGGDEERPKLLYPIGPHLAATERKIGYAHKPLGKKGRVLCYNFIAHSGCGKGDQRSFSHMQRIKPEGLRWAAQYDLARRGGLVSGKRIESNAAEGFLLALRSRNTSELGKSIEESRGSVCRRESLACECGATPPGLSEMIWISVTSSTTCLDAQRYAAVCNDTLPNPTIGKQELDLEDVPLQKATAIESKPTAVGWIAEEKHHFKGVVVNGDIPPAVGRLSPVCEEPNDDVTVQNPAKECIETCDVLTAEQ